MLKAIGHGKEYLSNATMQVSLLDVDILSYDIHDYKYRIDAHGKSVLRDLKNFIPRWIHKDIFIAGGFPAYLLGTINTHSDIDIFCATQTAFDTLKLEAKKANAMHIEDCEVLYEVPPAVSRTLKSNIIAHLAKIIVDGIRCDLVFAPYVNFVPEYAMAEATRCGSNSSINWFYLFRHFDINWSMAGFNINNDHIMAHGMQFSILFNTNILKTAHNIERTMFRFDKYTKRLSKPLQKEEYDAAMTFLKGLNHGTISK